MSPTTTTGRGTLSAGPLLLLVLLLLLAPFKTGVFYLRKFLSNVTPMFGIGDQEQEQEQ